jgi:hypothetical protein
MTMFKQHMGRRVAAVAVAAALLVLGLEAPAFAAAPTIGSFSPASGPVGCVVTITGTNFNNPNVTAVLFDTTPAASFRIDSGTSITAVVNTGTTTGDIHVTNADGTDASGPNFVVANTTCPTITSFTPTSGLAGTSVTLTGTNFTGATGVTFNNVNAPGFTVDGTGTHITVAVPTAATTGPIRVTAPGGTGSSLTNFTVPPPTITSFTPTFGAVGTSVKITGTNFTGATGVTFNNVTSTFVVNSATQITATVPTTATTGPIKVTTPAGSATSTTSFTVSKTHSRSITLSLKKHLVAQGKVSVGDGFTACASSVPVKIQRKKKGGGWQTVGSATTSASGSYKKKVKDKEGKYRAKAPKVALNNNVDICSGDTSPARKHNH